MSPDLVVGLSPSQKIARWQQVAAYPHPPFTPHSHCTLTKIAESTTYSHMAVQECTGNGTHYRSHLEVEREWKLSTTNFDNIFEAFLALLQVGPRRRVTRLDHGVGRMG